LPKTWATLSAAVTDSDHRHDAYRLSVLSSTVKSYLELRIQPREDKYYLIEVVNDPRGLTHFEQVDVDTTNTNLPGHYREVRTVTENSLRFSLQFAQSFGRSRGASASKNRRVASVWTRCSWTSASKFAKIVRLR